MSKYINFLPQDIGVSTPNTAPFFSPTQAAPETQMPEKFFPAKTTTLSLKAEKRQTVAQREEQTKIPEASKAPISDTPAPQTKEKGWEQKTAAEKLGIGHLDKDAQEEYIEKNAIAQLPDSLVKENIRTNEAGKVEWFAAMSNVFGGLSGVIGHFKEIKKADVPGDVHVHSLVAGRLEMVKKSLQAQGSVMPESSVALSNRRGLQSSTKFSHANAHPMGLAIDWRAYDNPMITDQRLRDTVKMVTGKGTGIEFSGGMENYATRRKLIREMAENTSAGRELTEQQKVLLAQFDAQYDEKETLSKKFTSELLSPKLLAFKNNLFSREQLKDTVEKIGKSIKRIQKSIQNELKKKKPGDTSADETLLKTLQQQYSDTQKQLSQTETDIQDAAKEPKELFKEWETKAEEKLKSAQEELNTQINAIEQKYTQQKATIEAEIEKIKKDIEELQKKREELQDKKARRPIDAQIREQQKYLEKKGREIGQTNKAKDRELKKTSSNLKNSVDNAQNLVNSFADKKYLFGDIVNKGFNRHTKGVKNPALMQLIMKGYFNPDKPADADKQNPQKAGFDKLFMRTMLLHGFEMGAAWGTSDTMHFELVEGFDIFHDKALPPEKISN